MGATAIPKSVTEFRVSIDRINGYFLEDNCISMIPAWGSLVRYKYTFVYFVDGCILNVAGGQHDAVHEIIPSRQIFILFYFILFEFLTESGDVSFLNPFISSCSVLWFWSGDRPVFASITRLI